MEFLRTTRCGRILKRQRNRSTAKAKYYVFMTVSPLPRPNRKWPSVSNGVSGAPGETRTPDPLLRRQTLYPAELRARRRPFHDGRPPGRPLSGFALAAGPGPGDLPWGPDSI